MALWGMVIDLDRCTGCQACVMACKAENNVPAVGSKEAHKGRVISWMQVLTETDEEHHAEKVRFIPRPCLQCDDPPCTKVCPVYATYRNPEGIVAQIYARCIGCRFCMAACPYNAKYFNWYTYQKEGQGQNPDVSLRGKGVVEKCTFCHHRVSKAPEGVRDLDPSDPALREYTPACVVTCAPGARYFGDLDDPDSQISLLIKKCEAKQLKKELTCAR